MLRIGIDTGGTFTDFVVLENRQISIFKLPSTPHEADKALLEGLSRVVAQREGFLLQHGSTVATNALIERKGAKTLLITNMGFEDLLEIGRQNRPELYNLESSRPEPLVPAKRRIGIKERRLWDGSELVPLEPRSLSWLKQRIRQTAPESIAVALIYAYVNPESELKIAEALKDQEIPVSLSHQILPEFREYERSSATVINAYLRPIMSAYLSRLSGDETVSRGRLTVMQSNGGAVSAAAAAEEPVRTLFSGPAGGVLGAFRVARQAGFDRILSLDMGGTSTDVSLCDGQIRTTKEATIDHMPLPVQMIDIHSVGAGGGSVAWVDPGGLLRVGPRSAGADPGPVCYGTGEEITVTDANVFLGLLDPDWFLGGEFPLSPEKIRPAMEKLAGQVDGGLQSGLDQLAEGIRRIVNTQMEGALRLISLERGYDTRDFTLVSFGGAGGLHACELASSLLIPRVLIPAYPGVLSALGILTADVVKESSLSVLLRCDEENYGEELQKAFLPLIEDVRLKLEAEGFSGPPVRMEQSLDLRYVGQSYELQVPLDENPAERFHQQHQKTYGYSNRQLPVETVTIRVRGSASFPGIELPRFDLEGPEPAQDALIQEKAVFIDGRRLPTSFYLRNRLRPGNQISGPAILLEYSATTLVPPGFQARVDEWLNLILERE